MQYTYLSTSRCIASLEQPTVDRLRTFTNEGSHRILVQNLFLKSGEGSVKVSHCKLFDFIIHKPPPHLTSTASIVFLQNPTCYLIESLHRYYTTFFVTISPL